ncbi:hypothetical protein HK405_009792 [Cladochytrium tenue]|nr:hypothetical protein HK405_009792 [Cladochytrium tenue]
MEAASMTPNTAGAGAGAAPSPGVASARCAVSCLVLGRPPASAFLVNCGDGSLPMSALAMRLDALLCGEQPGSAPASAGPSDPSAYGEKSGAPQPSPQAPRLQLFRALHGPGELTLASPELLPSNPALRDLLRRPRSHWVPPQSQQPRGASIRKVLEKFSFPGEEDDVDGGAVASARAAAVVDLLGRRCEWVAGAALGARVRDAVPASLTGGGDDVRIDFLVLVDGSASVPTTAAAADGAVSPVLPAYADLADDAVAKAIGPVAVVADLGTGSGSGAAQLGQFQAGALRGPPGGDEDGEGGAKAVPSGGLAAVQTVRRRRLLVTLIVLAVVVVVLAIAVPVGVVMSARKAAGSDISASTASAGSTSSGLSTQVASTGTSPGQSPASSAGSASADTTGSTSPTGTTSESSSQTTSSSSSTTASAAACSQTPIDTFASSTNSFGYSSTDDGTMTSLSRTGGQLVFVPKSGGSSYFYESLRSDSGGSCSSAVPAVGYLVFTMSGGGTAEVDIKTGCSETDHNSVPFTVTASAAVYAVNAASMLGSSSLAADISAVSWDTFLPSTTGTEWTLSDVYFANDLDACGVTATLIS